MLSFYRPGVLRKVSVCAKFMVGRATAGDGLWGGKYNHCRPYTILEADGSQRDGAEAATG